MQNKTIATRNSPYSISSLAACSLLFKLSSVSVFLFLSLSSWKSQKRMKERWTDKKWLQALVTSTAMIVPFFLSYQFLDGGRFDKHTGLRFVSFMLRTPCMSMSRTHILPWLCTSATAFLLERSERKDNEFAISSRKLFHWHAKAVHTL